MPKYVQRVQLTAGDELEVLVAPEGIFPVMSFLKNHHNAQFTNLADITAVDVPTREFRFEVERRASELKRFSPSYSVTTFLLPTVGGVQPALPEVQLSHPREDLHGRADPAGVRLRRVRRRELVRAGGLRHVRHLLRQSPGPQADPHRLRVRGTPAQEGLSTLRICRGLSRSAHIYPTNIASVGLVVGCPNSKAGVRIVKEKHRHFRATRATQIWTPSLITISGN